MKKLLWLPVCVFVLFGSDAVSSGPVEKRSVVLARPMDDYQDYQNGVRYDEYPIIVPSKRAAILIDRLMIALKKAIEEEEEAAAAAAAAAVAGKKGPDSTPGTMSYAVNPEDAVRTLLKISAQKFIEKRQKLIETKTNETLHKQLVISKSADYQQANKNIDSKFLNEYKLHFTSLLRKMSSDLLLCFGSPLMDIVIETTENFLHTHNLEPDTAVRATNEHKNLFLEIEKNPKKILQVGGTITNTVRVYRWISKKPVAYFGCIGDDDFGNKISSKITEEGILGLFEIINGVTTGKCAVLLIGRQRTLCTELGASKYFRKDILEHEKYKKIIESAKFIYFSAFFFGISEELAMKVTELCTSGDKKLIFNLGAPFLCQKYSSTLLKVHEYCDVIFGNEAEFRSFAKICNITSDDIKEICSKINMLPKANSNHRVTIVTRSDKSVLVAENGLVNEFDVPKITKKIVDTNGAGDAFVGGFLAQYVLNKQLDECIRCALWAAREIITSEGCNFNGNHNYK